MKLSNSTISIIVAIIVLFSPMISAKYSFIISGIVLIVYVVYLYFFDKKFLDTNKRGMKFAFLIAFLVAALIAFNLRFFSGEDDWICKDGNRIKHGNPSSGMPTSPCK